MFEENEVSIKANGGTELAKRHLAALLPATLQSEFQIICSRVRELDESKIRIYWVHDLPEDPECSKLENPDFRSQFHKIVYVSNWQYNTFRDYLNIPYSENDIIIENGIEPIEPNPNKNNDTIHLVYTSTPQRGLGILIPVFEALQKQHNNIHLHVFSSFKIYGWDEKDMEFEPLYERCKNNPNITYHGYVPYEQVRETISNSHILAYPCVWRETSCRALIEGMSGGLLCVHPNFAALPETSGGLNLMYQGDMEPTKHAQAFAHALHSAIDQVKGNNISNYLQFTKTYADTRHNISKITSLWQWQMEELLGRFPTEESRKFSKRELVFKV